MKYTAKQLGAKSDAELNKIIAIIKGFPEDNLAFSGSGVFIDGADSGWVDYDWINDDALSHRLVIDNKIDLLYLNVSKTYVARDSADNYIFSIDLTPNKAVAICFILMNQED